jgi:hypothetical protein
MASAHAHHVSLNAVTGARLKGGQRVKLDWRLVATGLLTFCVGAALAVFVLQPKLNDAAAQVEQSKGTAESALQAERDLESGVWFMLSVLPATREPQSQVQHGVYLAKVVDVGDNGTASFDWLTGAPDGFKDAPISNESTRTWTYGMLPLSKVVLSDADGFRSVSFKDFAREFTSDTKSGERLRAAYWWVTLMGEQWTMVQAPPR